MRARIALNTTAYVSAGMAPYVVNFLMLPLFTRHMTPGEYGILSLVNSFSSFLICFTGLQLALSLGRFYFDYDGREGVAEFFSTILITMLFSTALILLPMHFWGVEVTALVFPKAGIPYDPYVRLTLISTFLATFSPAFTFLLKVEERGGTVLKAALFNSLLGAAFGYYFVVARGMGAHGYLVGAVCTASFYNALLLLNVRKHLVPVFRLDMLRSALTYSLPLIPNALGAVVFIYSDKIILGYFVPIAQIGLYNIADRISMLLRLGVNSFHDANSPTFMRLSKKSRAEAVETYRTIITRWAVAVSTAYLCLAFFSEELILFMTPATFHGAYAFVPILLGAYIFRGLYCFVINTVMYEKKTKVVPLLTVLAGAFNVAGNILLIPLFGAIVAAWTTLGSYAITFLLALFFSNRHYPLQIEWAKLIRVFTLMAALSAAVYFLRGESRALNAALKLAGLAVFAAVMVRWNYGNAASDAGRALAWVLRKAGVRS